MVIAFLHELPCLWLDGIRYWGFRQSIRDHTGVIRYILSHIRGVAIFDKTFMTLILLSYIVMGLLKLYLSVSKCNNVIAMDDLLCFRLSGTSQLFLIICVISVWIYMLNFLVIHETFFPMVISILRIVSNDLPFFSHSISS